MRLNLWQGLWATLRRAAGWILAGQWGLCPLTSLPSLSLQSLLLRAAPDHRASPPFPSFHTPADVGFKGDKGQGGKTPLVSPSCIKAQPPKHPFSVAPPPDLSPHRSLHLACLPPCRQVPRSPRLQGQPPPGELLWVELCPPKRYVEAPTPTVCKCDLIWKQGFHVTMRSQEDPSPTRQAAFLMRENVCTFAEGRGPREDRGTDAPASRRNTKGYSAAPCPRERGSHGALPSEPAERADCPHLTLDSGLRSCDRINFCCLKPPSLPLCYGRYEKLAQRPFPFPPAGAAAPLHPDRR